MSESYAIIETGASQARVAPGDRVHIQKIPGAVGEKVTFSKVLLLSEDGKVQIGLPYVPGVKVEAEITAIGLEKKVLIAKFKRRKKIRGRRGHRQPFTEVKIIKFAQGAKPAKGETSDKAA